MATNQVKLDRLDPIELQYTLGNACTKLNVAIYKSNVPTSISGSETIDVVIHS